MSITETWLREPRQARSQATLERFVAATELLVQSRPFEEISVADIVRTAERTVGSFYARFDDKNAVLYVIVARMHDRMRLLTRAFCDPVRWEDRTLAEFVEESVRLNVMAYRRSGPLFRASLQMCAADERFRVARNDTMGLCAELTKAFVLSRVAELDAADPARASDLMVELMSATLDHELLFGHFTHTRSKDDSVLVAELFDQCAHILRLRP